MREVEVKIIGINVEYFRKKIIAMGARSVFKGEVHSFILDYDDYSLTKKDYLLRLRKFFDLKKNTFYELTIKGPRIKGMYKSREEINIQIKDNTILKIFKLLGLRIIRQNKKLRESYILKTRVYEKGKSRIISCHVDIDDYLLFPKFVELETKTKKDLSLILKKFSINKTNIYSISTAELFKMYNIKQNL